MQPTHSSVTWLEAPAVALDQDGPVDVPFTAFDSEHGPEQPVLVHLAHQVRRRPHHPAVQDDAQALSYTELLTQALALAAVLAEVVPPGQPVGLRLNDGCDGPMALLACLAAATPVVLLDRADPQSRLAEIAADQRLTVIITHEMLPGLHCLAPQGHPRVAFTPRPLAMDAPAFILCTSGSTGRPKGIVHSQRSVLHRAGLLVNSGHLHAQDRYLSLNTPSSMGAVLNAVAAWLAGATLHRVAVAEVGLGGVLKRLREGRITAVIGVPALYRALCRLKSSSTSLASLRLLSSNGEALMAADLALLRRTLPAGCAIQMVYGATETQAGMRFIPAEEEPAHAQVVAGRPIPGTRYAIVQEDGHPAAPGQAGELHILSRYTAVGEWQHGACVPGRLLPCPEAGPGWRRYAMGDWVRQRPDGALLVVGRADRQLKVNGHRVEPVEVEAVLRGHPEVLDAIALPVPGPMGPELVAFVASATPTPDALRQHLHTRVAEHLPAPLHPRRLHVLPRLPLLPSNKVDAHALRHWDETTGQEPTT